MQSSNQQDDIYRIKNKPALNLMGHFRLQNVNFRPATPPRVSYTKQQPFGSQSSDKSYD